MTGIIHFIGATNNINFKVHYSLRANNHLKKRNGYYGVNKTNLHYIFGLVQGTSEYNLAKRGYETLIRETRNGARNGLIPNELMLMIRDYAKNVSEMAGENFEGIEYGVKSDLENIFQNNKKVKKVLERTRLWSERAAKAKAETSADNKPNLRVIINKEASNILLKILSWRSDYNPVFYQQKLAA